MKKFLLGSFFVLYLVIFMGCDTAKTGNLIINDQSTVENKTYEGQVDGDTEGQVNEDTNNLELDITDESNNELEDEIEEVESSVMDNNIDQEPLELGGSDKDMIEITEKMYVSYINDIYTNPDEYLGKNIVIEGMYTADYYEETDTTYYYVYRVGPGCCGNDGSMCGFEFTTIEELPAENDWIEVKGTLKSYLENGQTYLTLGDSKITVKQERGKENVNQ